MIPKNNDMRFEVSTQCNYQCVICPHDKLTRKKEIMSFDLFKLLFDKIIDETDQYDTLTFPGMGEPLLDKGLGEKIAYAKQKSPGIKVLILTNGSFLTPEKFKEFNDLGVESIRVSFYGVAPESYNAVHGIKDPMMYEKIESYLDKITSMERNTMLLLTYNLVKGANDSVWKDWVARWENKADLLEVWMPHNWVDFSSFRSVQDKKFLTCGRPFTGPLQVQVDGTVNMCCFDYDGKLTLGDLKSQSLAEIFSSPMFEKILESHKTGDYQNTNLICKNCDQRNSDKSNVMIYNSKFDITERVKQLSTTYIKVQD